MSKEEQLSFANAGFERYARSTRRSEFRAKMEAVVPSEGLCALIRPRDERAFRVMQRIGDKQR